MWKRVVIVNKLSKKFEIPQKERGIKGSILSYIKPKKKIVKAISNISFSIEEGELVGFIGPNGAGKTTTLKILSGLLYPSGGLVSVLGFDPWERKPEYLKQISLVMGQKSQLWWDIPSIETLKLNKEIYNLNTREYENSLAELVNVLDIGKILDIPVRRLSLGQRMKMELAASLLHKPKVLFLDEPTIGLDIVTQVKVKEFISDYNRKNSATIMLTSHNVNDVMDLAKRIIVIDKGRIVFDGPSTELIRTFAKRKIIKIYLSDGADIKKLESIGKIKNINFPQVTLSVSRQTSALAASQILQDFPVKDLDITEEPIEDIIGRVFKKGI